MENRDRPGALGSASCTKKLEHAPPSAPLRSPGLGMENSLEKPRVVLANNHQVAPGAFPVPSSQDVATNRTSSIPIGSDDSTREFAYEECKLEEGLSNPVDADTGGHDSSRPTTESGLYTVEAERVPDGKEEGTILVAEAHYVSMKWYQRPLYRWILVGSILFVGGLVGAVVALVVRPSSAASSSSSSPPTPAPTYLTPEESACNFLSMSDVTKCRSTVKFDSYADDKTTGFTIPSEIGLLTQLKFLNISSNALTSTIPSEVGLLQNLMTLSFANNKLTSKIPSEIGLMQNLTYLSFWSNSLTSTIPSEIGLLQQLTILSFQSNFLTSTIPSEIGFMQELSVLSFSSNELTSTIPIEIGQLQQLESLYLYENKLKGSIPSSLCSLFPLNSSIFIDCGEITCDSDCCWDIYGKTCA